MATGQRYERLANGQIRRTFERSTGETTTVDAPVFFCDDFLGKQLMLSETGSTGRWEDTLVSSNSTVAIVSATDAPNGVMAVALTSDSEEQQARLDFGDVEGFNPNKYLQVEFRVNLAVTPTLVAEISFGLSGAANKVTESQGDHVSFIFDGSVNLLVSTDDGTTDTTATDTTIDGADGTYLVCRIDLTELDDVKFFVNGSRVLGSTTFDVSGLAATDYLQPYVQAYKASGAGVGTLEVDYVKAWSIR